MKFDLTLSVVLGLSAVAIARPPHTTPGFSVIQQRAPSKFHFRGPEALRRLYIKYGMELSKALDRRGQRGTEVNTPYSTGQDDYPDDRCTRSVMQS